MVSRAKLKTAAIAGLKKGWHSFVWTCEIIIPVSLLVAVLQWTGWLNHLDTVLQPLMNLLHLPAAAAIPIVVGMLVNQYASIAIMTVVPFTIQQITLIAIFNLIAHSLIMEGIVQYRSGINVIKTTLIRIIAAIAAVFAASLILGNTMQSVPLPAALSAQSSFPQMMSAWALSTLILLLKVFGIITAVMILLEMTKAMGWTGRLLTVFRPVVIVMGLSQRTVIMFVTGIVFGLLYGGAVIVEEGKKQTLTRDELERLHISLGINHSMVEDPALFAALGVNLLWSWIPRLVMAVIAVQLYNLWRRLRRKPKLEIIG